MSYGLVGLATQKHSLLDKHNGVLVTLKTQKQFLFDECVEGLVTLLT
jgi:hypothetical protein